MTETVGTTASGRERRTALDGRASAKAGKAAGLTVERIYTTAGVHPYDEVTWERRDVVMTNWRDGSVNFEQRGVEFPDFWSVNATNIVTSKYFRGAVGTPAARVQPAAAHRPGRRRLPPRPASSTATSPPTADAEIFDHELTWMLLHQVFSFNSPVWFNVGTPRRSRSAPASSSPSTTPWTRSSTGTGRRG